MEIEMGKNNRIKPPSHIRIKNLNVNHQDN